MKKNLNKIDFAQIIDISVPESYRIGDDVLLMNDYQLKPIRGYQFTAPWNQFVEVTNGKGTVEINNKTFEVNGHVLIGYMNGQPVKVNIGGSATRQRGIIFSDGFMDDLYRNSSMLSGFISFLIQHPVMPVDEEMAKGLILYARLINHLVRKGQDNNILISAKHATLSLFYGYMYEKMISCFDNSSLRRSKISSDFIKLLEHNFISEHNIDFYADSLNISRCYLHECIVKNTGKTPGAWLDYYLISEAKNLLLNHDLSVLQVAQSLNYSGSSQFGKFFKKQTGMTPGEYRASIY